MDVLTHGGNQGRLFLKHLAHDWHNLSHNSVKSEQTDVMHIFRFSLTELTHSKDIIISNIHLKKTSINPRGKNLQTLPKNHSVFKFSSVLK